MLPHKGFLVSVEDFAFWVYCGAKVFLLMYYESNGTLRWFAVIGALSGMFLYKKIVSYLFVKYASFLLRKILGVLRKIFGFLCKPLGFCCDKTQKGLRKTGGKLHRILGKVKRGIKNKLTFSLKILKINFKT